MDEYSRWQRAGAEAARGAGLQATAGLYHWAAFQYEQAAQLALKGFLHGIGVGPEAWGHDVYRLGDAVARAIGEPLGDGLTAGLKRLARHYISARYPDAVPGQAPSAYYSKEDAQAAREDAAATRAAIEAWWAALLQAQERSEEPDEGRPGAEQ
ncbi:MAG: HEPN domain-containing protein [Acidimicrobiales bacterium]